MAQTNEGRGSGETAITISNNNGDSSPHSGDRGDPSTTTAASKDSEQPKAVHKFLSTTAKLGYFLPTGTSMLFDTAVPKIYRNGQCSYIGTIMMWLLLGLCVAICIFSQFTDSKTSDNAKDHRNKKVEYEFVEMSKWKFADGVQAITSVVAFLAIAFSDQRVVDCVLPKHVKEVEEVMLSLHIIVLSVCSFVHLVFPTKRRGLVPKLAYD